MNKNLLAALAACLPAAALAADAGFATQVAGKVAFHDGTALEAFSKLRPGDQLQLAAGAKLQVVYFDSGRQETWAGPCALAIAAKESEAKNCAAPTVKQLPPAIVAALVKTPDNIADIRNRSGMVRMRAIAPKENLATADSEYKALREQAAADDITPELYLFSRQWAAKQTTEAAVTLDEMAKRQPNSPEVAALRAKLQALLGGTKPAQ